MGRSGGLDRDSDTARNRHREGCTDCTPLAHRRSSVPCPPARFRPSLAPYHLPSVSDRPQRQTARSSPVNGQSLCCVRARIHSLDGANAPKHAALSGTQASPAARHSHRRYLLLLAKEAPGRSIPLRARSSALLPEDLCHQISASTSPPLFCSGDGPANGAAQAKHHLSDGVFLAYRHSFTSRRTDLSLTTVYHTKCKLSIVISHSSNIDS